MTNVVTRHGRRFLIADDNHDGADSLAMLLRLQGCEVETAYDGDDAVTAFIRARADVVLLDIGMPKRTGHEVCRAIRELPGGVAAVIIAVTGRSQPQDRQRSQESGFDAHLVKPVDHAMLRKLCHV